MPGLLKHVTHGTLYCHLFRLVLWCSAQHQGDEQDRGLGGSPQAVTPPTNEAGTAGLAPALVSQALTWVMEPR